jgi:hypothetical protein
MGISCRSFFAQGASAQLYSGEGAVSPIGAANRSQKIPGISVGSSHGSGKAREQTVSLKMRLSVNGPLTIGRHGRLSPRRQTAGLRSLRDEGSWNDPQYQDTGIQDSLPPAGSFATPSPK